MTARRTDKPSLGPRNSWVSVYDGKRCRDHVISRGRDGFEAFDIDDRSIGHFATQAAAANALTATPRSERGGTP
jgi:hypothetical protein